MKQSLSYILSSYFDFHVFGLLEIFFTGLIWQRIIDDFEVLLCKIVIPDKYLP
jgi:hypothetical protein